MNFKNVLPTDDSRNQLSVHFVMVPEADKVDGADEIIRAVSHMQQVVLLGRKIREQRCVNLKTPVQSVTVVSSDPIVLKDVAELESYICDELNAIEIKTSSDVTGIETIIKPNFAALKDRFASSDSSGDDEKIDFGKLIKNLTDALKSISPDQVSVLSKPDGGRVSFGTVLDGSVEFSASDLLINRDVSKIAKTDANLEYGSNAGNAVVVVDFTPKPDLIKMAIAREIANKVQKLRKAAGLNMNDKIEVFLSSVGSGADDELSQVLEEKREYIESIVKKPVHSGATSGSPSVAEIVIDTIEDLNEQSKVAIKVVKMI
jgi:isoleucyl-tRNA synthetase